MPSYKFTKPYYNVAKLANEVSLEEAWNVYFEAIPEGGFAVRRRPGIVMTDMPTAGAKGRGIYWSDRNKKLYIVQSNGVFYKPANPSAIILISPLVAGTFQDFKIPAVFAEGQKLDAAFPIIYIANGNGLNYIDVKPAEKLVNIPSPDIVSTFVAMMNNRFYSNDNTFDKNQDFWITDVNPATNLNDPLFWNNANNPWRAAQKPDYINGITTGWNETYLWGTTACEVWQEDGVNPISPLMGSLMEIGLEAPYSIQKADNTYFMLATVSGKRAVIRVKGRGPQVISEPIANILQSYEVVNDAIGSLCFVGGLNMYVLSFPTENVTWAYDFKSDVWSQWSTWDMGNGKDNMFRGLFSQYATDWNQHVVQLDDGTLCEYSREAYQDFPGNSIHSTVRTGWIDHGTWDRKRLDQLIIKMQGYLPKLPTQYGVPIRPVKVTLRMRIDGFPEWGNPIEIEVQAGSGQNDHFCKLNRLGMHRSVQFEFNMTDARDLALVGMEIDVTRMRN